MNKLKYFINPFTLIPIGVYMLYDIWLGLFAPGNISPSVGLFLRFGFRPLLLLVFLFGVYKGLKGFTSRSKEWTLLILVISVIAFAALNNTFLAR